VKFLIVAEHIDKSFGKLLVLKDVSLTVARGEVVVIIGPSGSGKSTFLRCLNYLETIDDGYITMEDGRLVNDSRKNVYRLRSRMGMVFQRFNLFPHQTALQNVMEGSLTVAKIPVAEARARSLALLIKVGLADKVNA